MSISKRSAAQPTIVLGIAAFLLLSVLGMAQLYVAGEIYRAGRLAEEQGTPPVSLTLGVSVAMGIAGSVLATVAVYAVVWVWRLLRIGRRSRLWTLLAYPVFCMLFTFARVGGMSLAFVLTSLDDTYGLSQLPLVFLVNLRNLWAFEVVMFLLLVGAYWAWSYYQEARDHELQEARLQAQLAETRLDALRAQLNPHFLFNSLNAISSLALKGDSVAVPEMIGRLSMLLRTALDRGHSEISLARELGFIDDYVAIHELRFPDRLTVERSVSPDTLSALVPAMILQPIVENAIKHGVAKRRGQHRIRLGAVRNNGSLVLEVCDSGPGFPLDASHGIGLENTKERLDQLYGSAQRLEIEHGPDGGSTVRLTIPYVEAQAAASA